jgi:hypothetical protein
VGCILMIFGFYERNGCGFKRVLSAGYVAERVGFEPTWEQAPHLISSQRRYDRFGTSPLQGWDYMGLCLPIQPGWSKTYIFHASGINPVRDWVVSMK